jgi:predicted amidohydrolase
MNVALCQLKPTAGNIGKNITRHLEFIEVAISNAADFIVFPELSLTGYEPALANQLAMNLADQRLDVFQEISNVNEIAIAVGLPCTSANGITISLAIFQPHVMINKYSKDFLHPDEYPNFIPGTNLMNLSVNDTKIALAICYELSVKEHIERSFSTSPDVYIASVAKSEKGVKLSEKILSETARKNATLVMMCNSVGLQDGGECAGTTSAWNPSGNMLCQLDTMHEGILFVDTKTLETKDFYFS